MPEWLAQLAGDAEDLRLLSEHLLSNDPSVKEEEDGYWLRYSGFELLTKPIEVYELANRRLEEILGIAKLLGGGILKVEVVGLAQENDAGSRPQYVFLEGVPSEERFGMSTETFVRVIAVAERNSEIAKALTYYKRGDWINLYRAWERITCGSGGRFKNWTSRKERSRFTNTANNYEAIGDEARHGVRTGDPPRKPMSIDEAREFVGRSIKAWIREPGD